MSTDRSITIQLITMILILLFACLPLFTFGSHLSHLPAERKACKSEKITYVPVEKDYYEEPIELFFDSGLNFNHIPVTKILKEECGLIDKEIPSLSRRDKRSPFARGIYRLSKYFIHFYQKSKKMLKPELLRSVEKVVEKLNHIKPSTGKVKFAGIGKFFREVWENLEDVLREENDDHVNVILEHTFRTSLQLLIHQNETSEMILNHPKILDKIKKRIPVENPALLSSVRVSSVECHPFHRDSQAVLYFKLRIPKVERLTIEKCDDIGTITENSYQFYEIPTATFKRNGHVFKVDLEKCVSDSFTFCPFDSIRPTDCSKEKLQHCNLKKEELGNFSRELQQGFAVYGDFKQILMEKNELQDLWLVKPRTLYHIIPQTNETITIGEKTLKQDTHSNVTVIRQV
ncbi:unnamed protein product [Caenorhabditis nigoni]|uniref:Uncharacterized protein n=2 Tax=Caenorhabditis nigoni TaxID=1611254 RepID=A0A2G5TIH0_9PELO|nr:hypothetical protein B9Z55_019458 [Caenorhabditis nigoni]